LIRDFSGFSIGTRVGLFFSKPWFFQYREMNKKPDSIPLRDPYFSID
jgi:hypothetical protein